MSTRPLGKQDNRAINVGNEPGGEEGGEARRLGPHPEANRLGDGGRGSSGHPEETAESGVSVLGGLEAGVTGVENHLRPPAKSTREALPVRAIVRLPGTGVGPNHAVWAVRAPASRSQS
eukprot:5512090-Alexandrium_andersonii.AAC.1